VETARLGEIRGLIEATGLVAAAPGAEQLVVPPQEARIAELPKAVGDTVRKGDLLVRFEIPALTADAAGKAAAHAQAEARRGVALANRDRVAGLLDRGIAARKELEEAQKELAEAEAGVATAAAERRAAEQVAARSLVRARFDGIVARRTHNPGDLVDASGNDPILRLVDASRLQVEAAVAIADLNRVRVGNAARVVSPGASAEQDFSAQVVSVPAAVEAGTGTAPVRLSLPRGAALAVGLPVSVQIAAEQRKDVVIVPASALVHDAGKAFVYAVDGQGKAHRREAQVGIEANGEAEILGGVAAGERVVVKGHQALPDGASVTVGG
jgi:RND family efflux transporter MFP subunit